MNKPAWIGRNPIAYSFFDIVPEHSQPFNFTLPLEYCDKH